MAWSPHAGEGGSRIRIAIEVGIASLAAAAAVAALLWHDWIERILPFEPDGGSGAVERALTLGLILLSLSSSMLALVERRLGRVARVAPAGR